MKCIPINNKVNSRTNYVYTDAAFDASVAQIRMRSFMYCYHMFVAQNCQCDNGPVFVSYNNGNYRTLKVLRNWVALTIKWVGIKRHAITMCNDTQWLLWLCWKIWRMDEL